MARSWRDRFLRRRRQPQASHSDDRISALSDDLLLDVLRRLDTRSALGAGMLSTRWACLPRELPALDFRVDDILPPRYHRWLLHRDTEVTVLDYQLGTAKVEKVMPHIKRYERRAMRALTRSVDSFLEADVGRRSRSRRVSRLRIEFFATHNTGCINRLVARAIDAWEVDDLVAVAKPISWQCPNFHDFPSHGICQVLGLSTSLTSRLAGNRFVVYVGKYSTYWGCVWYQSGESTAGSGPTIGIRASWRIS
ncbi:hypothetical protein QYE76_007611 [Lolium multiflorum]|uniref:F-box domain-containing protein n=1 Tax=Lolium multiflorum TaxID=4521 RepID=A0AAD8QH35_LOLMU|nr:hypothetical protein QYE76_007611 [Lolium multiflorum]